MNPAPATTLVVGTGYVGRRVLEAFDDGEVIGLNRSTQTPGKPVHRFDLDADALLPVSLPDQYRVLYTVAPSNAAEHDVRLQRFLKALPHAPAAFVYISTTGVYGDRDGAVVAEDSDPDPRTARAKRRVAAEQALATWGRRDETRVVILRVPGIYGPGRLGLERIRSAEPLLCEADAGPGNRIHVDDLASCCIAALTSPAAAGVFNVGDGDERTSTWFAQEVARQAGLDARPTVSRTEADATFSARRLSFLRESRRVDTRRMRDVLGVTPRYANAEAGIRASLDEERLAGQG